jgi:hypothetical protein
VAIERKQRQHGRDLHLARWDATEAISR